MSSNRQKTAGASHELLRRPEILLTDRAVAAAQGNPARTRLRTNVDCQWSRACAMAPSGSSQNLAPSRAGRKQLLRDRHCTPGV